VLPVKMPPAEMSGKAPAQVSLAGAAPALHEPQVQVPAVQVWVAVHTPTVQDRVVPDTHSNPSSVAVSQSSSSALHASAGGLQADPAGSSQLLVHVPLPVVPQLVGQETAAPLTQA
jgi:hypothetical protein